LADLVERAAQSSAGVSFSVEERETKAAAPAFILRQMRDWHLPLFSRVPINRQTGLKEHP
jgi:hypothetical protein